MILNERFQPLREGRKFVILSVAFLIAAVGGLLSSLELTHAATPTLAAESPAGARTPRTRRKTRRSTRRKKRRRHKTRAIRRRRHSTQAL